jgi:hypothetical protein
MIASSLISSCFFLKSIIRVLISFSHGLLHLLASIIEILNSVI